MGVSQSIRKILTLLSIPPSFMYRTFINEKFSSFLGSLAAIVTIAGFSYTAYQVRELGKEADLRLRFDPAVNTVNVTTEKTYGPIDLRLQIANQGEREVSNWRASMNFCKDVEVVNIEGGWKGGLGTDSTLKNHYVYKSQELIPKELDRGVISSLIDNAGMVRVRISADKQMTLSEGVPFAVIFTAGVNNKNSMEFVWFDDKKLNTEEGPFSYIKVDTNNGKTNPDIGKCRVY